MKTNIQKVYSKLPQKKHNFGKHKIDLGLVDDIKSKGDSISKMIGFVRQDKQDVEMAISKMRMIKTEYNSTIAMADELDDLYNKFDEMAYELGLEIPDDIYSIGRNSKELRTLTDELAKLINNI
tara:strand:- start:44 stop:415 length:372 start_codon:yes stop_codon:yes gene_type:complete